MKQIFLFVFGIFLFNSCGDQAAQITEAPLFPYSDFKKAVAYHYDGSFNGRSIIYKGKLHPTASKAKELKSGEIESFLRIVNDKESYRGEAARCFSPHMGVVFYGSGNAVIAHISVCFECNNHSASPDVKASKNTEFGYSNSARNALIALCEAWELGSCAGVESK